MELKERVYERLVVDGLFDLGSQAAIVRLARALNATPNKIYNALEDLSAENRISMSASKITNTSPLLQAKFKATNKKFGFVSIPGHDREIFVADKKTAFNNDIVEVGFLHNGDKVEAFISKIVERKNVYVLGQVVKSDGNRLIFVPDDRTLGNGIYIPQDEVSRAALNKKCAFKLSFVDEKDGTMFGNIDKVFGKAGDPIVENVAIAYQYGFKKEFPEQVVREVKNVPQVVSSEEIKGRLDLRDKKFVTIDPATCKDMDDAVYIEKVKEGYKVYVAIADVAHYVKQGSEIDKEGYARGTSCYLGDGVYPMLPEELSNGICSLNEKVDRLALCTITTINDKGEILDYSVNKAVINSKHKLSYEVAEKIHDCTDGCDKEYADVKKEIDLMYEASDILVDARYKRGALSLNTKEPTFKLDETKTKVEEVVDKSGITSKAIIESFMVLSNETIGKFFEENNLETLFRVHEKPNERRLTQVYPMLKGLGVTFNGDTSCYGLQKLLKSVEGKRYEDFVNGQVLRCLSKAKYQPENVGHYGLGSEAYIHFTSPIRRYPDTLTHRLVHEFLEHGMTHVSKKQLTAMGEHLTGQERQAEAAERISDKFLETMWAEQHLDEVMQGYVHSVELSGINVRYGLVNLFIPVTELKDGTRCEYRLNKFKTALVNRQTGKEYKIGDDVEMKIYSADRNAKTVYATTDLQKEVVDEYGQRVEKEKPKVRKPRNEYYKPPVENTDDNQFTL